MPYEGFLGRLGAALGVSKVFFRFPEALKSDLGRVLGSILRETGRQERNKGSQNRFGVPFWLSQLRNNP